MKLTKKINMLEGPIGINLFKLSMPIIFTSLVSIFYNLIDSKFISMYLGDEALVAAAGSGFFINLGFCLLNVPKLGIQVLSSQSIGSKKILEARKYARIAIFLSLIAGIIYTLFNVIFSTQLITSLGIKDVTKLKMASDYLIVTAYGYIPLYLIITMSTIISSDGDTFGPFVLNSIGLILNAIMDIIFLGYFDMDIRGAAWATTISQVLTLIAFIFYINRKSSRFKNIKYNVIDKYKDYIKLLKLGVPSGINSALFSLFAFVLVGIISGINENAIGIQRLGIQYEAFSWNISFGLASAVATYVGQNYGAKNYNRIKQTYRMVMKIVVIMGIIITGIFLIFSRGLYEIYFKDEKMIKMGISYLSILGVSQLFMCMEINITGAFNGLGKTLIPTLNSIIVTFMRIPIAYLLIQFIGLNGVWWAISVTSIMKGIILFILFELQMRKKEYN